MMFRWISTAGLVLLSCVSVALPALGQAYPARAIRLIVGFGPASSADILARLLAKQMEQTFGQPVVVENRPGNSSMLAADAVARAAPDGYTLFMATVANTLNPAQTDTTFNLARDMAPVALLGVVPNVLAVHPSVPATTLAELVALARSKPDSLTFASSGAGTASHLAAELFNSKAGVKLVTVHYQGGSSQAVTDLLAGRTTAMFNVAATLAPQIAAGSLRAIAVAQSRRSPVLPEVPTMDEAGMPGFDAGVWMGLMAPSDTPPDIVSRLADVATGALRSDPVQGALKQQGIDPIGSGPEAFARFIREDIEKWNAVVRAAGLGKK